jgi:hypothetical protein
MPLRAHGVGAGLATVAQRDAGTRHTCEQTKKGDDQPTVLIFGSLSDIKINRTPQRAVICSGIVGMFRD